eukprot:Hpha_TRINITY_DN13943_c1_g1::TRINITY_DN13943_c1_g1_i3::g.35249::m.35249/K08741/MSH5; DNA mismatch repair protein MSH5
MVSPQPPSTEVSAPAVSGEWSSLPPPPSSSPVGTGTAEGASGDGGAALEDSGGVRVLAVYHRGDVYGYAAYDSALEQVSAGSFADYSPWFLNLNSLRVSVAPAVVLIPEASRAVNMLFQEPAVPGGTPPEVKKTRADVFEPGGAVSRVYELYSSEFADEQRFRTELEGAVDTRCPPLMGALSALVSLLVHGSVMLQNGDVVTTKVRGLPKFLSPKNVLALDARALSALRVFHIQRHPAAHQGLGREKEGMSLFSLLNRCRTSSGVRLLRAWMAHPSRQLPELHRRHSAVAVLAAPENAARRAQVIEPLRWVKDPERLLKKFRLQQPTVQDWEELFRLTYACQALHENLDSLRHLSPILADAADDIAPCVPEVRQVQEVLAATIDWPPSFAFKRLQVRWGVDRSLDEHRGAFKALDGLMARTSEALRQQLTEAEGGEFPYDVNCVYYPQLGYFAVVDAAYETERGTTELPGFEFTNNRDEGGGLMYKCAVTDRLDETYGDLYGSVQDIQLDLVKRLTERVLVADQRGAFTSVVQPTAVVDCIAALAQTASEHGWCRPKMVSEPVLEIVEGRHPLQEHYVERFVPNSTNMLQGGGRLHLVTGPNGSGKSVYVKQVAALVYLAHVGSFVPARAATVGLADRIFTRLPSEDTPSWHAGAFGEDLAQISAILRYATPRSIVAIDEFGKGTDAADGVALLAASLNFLVPEPSHRKRTPNLTPIIPLRAQRRSPLVSCIL